MLCFLRPTNSRERLPIRASLLVPTPGLDALPMEPMISPPYETYLEEGIRYRNSGHPKRALRAFLPLLDPLVPASYRSQTHCQLSILYRMQGEWDQALEQANLAYQVAQEAQRPDLAYEAMNAEGACLWQQGHLGAAEEVFQRILAEAGPEAHKARGLALCNLGALAGDQDRLSLAKQCFETARECFVLAGYEAGEMTAIHNLAKTKLDSGDLDGAAADFRRMREAAQAAGDVELAALAATNLADAMARGGKPETSVALVGQAIGEFSLGNNEYRRCYSLGVFADICLLRGQREMAIRSLLRGVEVAERKGFTSLQARLSERLLSVARGSAEQGAGVSWGMKTS